MSQSHTSHDRNDRPRGKQTWILALGSPHGDDRAAWQAADLLAADTEIAPCVRRLATPWDIIHYANSGDSLIIVDACRGVSEPGSVTILSGAELSRLSGPSSSTHGVNLQEVVQFAEQLRGPLAALVILAIEVVDCEPGNELSAVGGAGAARAAELIRTYLADRSFPGQQRGRVLPSEAYHA